MSASDVVLVALAVSTIVVLVVVGISTVRDILK